MSKLPPVTFVQIIGVHVKEQMCYCSACTGALASTKSMQELLEASSSHDVAARVVTSTHAVRGTESVLCSRMVCIDRTSYWHGSHAPGACTLDVGHGPECEPGRPSMCRT